MRETTIASTISRAQRALPSVVFLLAAGLAADGLASSTTVIGASNAQRCYEYATANTLSYAGLDACDSALTEEPLSDGDLAATLVNRGMLRARRGRFEAAVRDYDRAIEIDPALVHALINRGNALTHLKRFDDALADYEQALFYSQGRDALLFYNRSLAYEKLGRKAEAREDLVRALQLQPDSRMIREALASLE
ncbi:MAG TPA: tetratricopeptide repeat protein [Pseudomonadales bacterium]|nr:tetratricopeptide repeat protein [Pseudomonadales bacterium]